mmetsp:Transcript_42861/g.77059  ORF Transcript_42861/g.77059 Transcript_42861/m.77059 type:complete len:234 (-) Transcript_42861:803-1504(-)
MPTAIGGGAGVDIAHRAEGIGGTGGAGVVVVEVDVVDIQMGVDLLLVDRVGPSKEGVHVVHRDRTKTVFARLLVPYTQIIIDLDKDVDLVGVPEVTLEVAMTLPEADGRAAQAFLDVSEVEDGRVIMVVVTMVIVVILEEMTRHILGGCFLAFTDAARPCFRRELISIEGPRLHALLLGKLGLLFAPLHDPIHIPRLFIHGDDRKRMPLHLGIGDQHRRDDVLVDVLRFPAVD